MILANPDGVGAASQPWIATGEPSIVDAQRDNGKRFMATADQKLSAFVELERQVLTVTFYLESIQ